mgnify:CR=1 FL=1
MQDKNHYTTELKISKLFLFCFYIILSFYCNAQSENKFSNEVIAITAKYDTIWDTNRETIVFTGSSSVRLWKNLEQGFPDHQIVNSGFGGSESSDLLHFLNDLVLMYNPKKVFIYEGDNDLWAKKRPNQVLDTTEEIIRRIKANNRSTQIILIAAKPSLRRWAIRRKYKKLNRKFDRLAKKDIQIDFVDVWQPMLNNRKPMTDIFIEDGLHMNQKGYDIWYEAMKNLVNNP